MDLPPSPATHLSIVPGWPSSVSALRRPPVFPGVKSEVLGTVCKALWLLAPSLTCSCHTWVSLAFLQHAQPAPTSDIVLTAWNTVFPSADTPHPFPSGLGSSPPYRQTFPDLGKLECSKWQPFLHFLTLWFFFLKALSDTTYYILSSHWNISSVRQELSVLFTSLSPASRRMPGSECKHELGEPLYWMK